MTIVEILAQDLLQTILGLLAIKPIRGAAALLTSHRFKEN